MQRSNEQNSGSLVTGVLVSIDNYFVEVLESSTPKISVLLKQIINNPAHANLVVKSICNIDRRRFREFPKEGCFVIKASSNIVRDFTIHEHFNPYELDTNSLTEFALEVPNYYKCVKPKQVQAA